MVNTFLMVIRDMSHSNNNNNTNVLDRSRHLSFKTYLTMHVSANNLSHETHKVIIYHFQTSDIFSKNISG